MGGLLRATGPGRRCATAAQALLNPTNGSSYRGTLVQTQQVASSRLRAMETGRWLVQVAPTGFSAFVSPSGEVIDRTAVSEAAVAVHDISAPPRPDPLHPARQHPVRGPALVLLAAAWLLDRRARPPHRPTRHAEQHATYLLGD